MIINKIKLLIFSLLLIFFLQKNLLGIENKIIYKINNEIITSIDIQNEINYLTALNPSLKKLEYNEIIEISKKSIVREKIKGIEISNQFNDAKVPIEFLENSIKNIYTKIGINNLNKFKEYLNLNKVNYQNVLKKIETETLWNELIVMKYSKKIKIDQNKLREKILRNRNIENKSYLMSEIVFEVSKVDELEEKYQEIIETINRDGFENAALKFSISETSNLGGKLNWINEKSLNKNIVNTLSLMKKNEFTKPIPVPGGFIILFINDMEIKKSEINIENELKKLIAESSNNQLNQFSKIYFNKIKEDIEINEI